MIRNRGARRRWFGLLAATCAAVAVSSAVLGQGDDRAASTAQEPIAPLPLEPWLDPERVALGERLFHDPRLSGSGTLSCASCHDLATNGASGTARDRGDDGETLALNTPTVFNVRFSYRLGWQARFRDLAEHAAELIENQGIMGASLSGIVTRLRADRDLAETFRGAYGRPVDEASVIDALVAFERSLVTPDAPFDRWLKGDADALTSVQLEGYELFKSAGCAACHQGAMVGANLSQRQGVFQTLVARPPDIVRVPSLRNVAATAPYFHDGSAATLAEAVRRMARAQLGADLSPTEVDALVAFLGALTGTWRGVPVHPAP